METKQTNGNKNKALAITGTASKLCRLYVDSNAAVAGANGTAQKPFRTIGEALAKCPAEVVQNESGMTEFRVIEVSGMHDTILIDRPIVIAGTYWMGNVTINVPDGYCMFTGDGFIGVVTMLETGQVSFKGVSTIGDFHFNGVSNVAFENCWALNGCFFDNPDMALNYTNCKVNSRLALPSEVNFGAWNCCFLSTQNTGLTGKIINSYNAGS